jgi:hypothetical protein
MRFWLGVEGAGCRDTAPGGNDLAEALAEVMRNAYDMTDGGQSPRPAPRCGGLRGPIRGHGPPCIP